MHLLILGGSDAGISAALRAQEREPGTEIANGTYFALKPIGKRSVIELSHQFPKFGYCRAGVAIEIRSKPKGARK